MHGKVTTRLGTVTLMAFLFCAPLVIFGPVIFGGYTFCRSPEAITAGPTFGNSATLPVFDVVSAFQDEPWLVYIKDCLRRYATVPLVNVKNGLGAPFLESLQPAPFYPLNLVLLFLDTTKPLYFDLFVLLHIYVFLFGLYLLLRLHCRPWLAVAITILLVFSGVTYNNLNMVHFRGFVWLPWVLLYATRLARGQCSRAVCLGLFAAAVMSLTAGNLQDFIITMSVAAACFGIEAALDRQSAMARRAALYLTIVTSVCLIGSTLVLPYLCSRANNSISTPDDPGRSLWRVTLPWLTNLVVPKANGIPPFFFRAPAGHVDHPEIPTTAFFLTLLGLLAALSRQPEGEEQKRTARRILLYSFLLWAGILKVGGFPLFDFVAHVPLLREIRFVKYSLYIHVLVAIISAIGIERLLCLSVSCRKRFTFVGGFITFGCVAAIAVWFALDADFQLRTNTSYPNFSEYRMVMLSSLGICLLVWVALFLFERKPSLCLIALPFLALASGVCLRPNGYFGRPSRFHHIGQQAPIAKARVLAPFFGNTNLFYRLTAITVFDPIFNTAWQRAMKERFDLFLDPYFITPRDDTVIDRERFAFSQLCAVDFITGYRTQIPYDELSPAGQGLFKVRNPLPRFYFLNETDYARFQDTAYPSTEALVADLRTGIRSFVDAAEITERPNSFEFPASSAAPSSGVLIATLAFTPNWTFQGRRAQPFRGLFAAWHVRAGELGKQNRIRFYPVGMRGSLILLCLGLLIITLTLIRPDGMRAVLRAGLISLAMVSAIVIFRLELSAARHGTRLLLPGPSSDPPALSPSPP